MLVFRHFLSAFSAGVKYVVINQSARLSTEIYAVKASWKIKKERKEEDENEEKKVFVKEMHLH